MVPRRVEKVFIKLFVLDNAKSKWKESSFNIYFDKIIGDVLLRTLIGLSSSNEILIHEVDNVARKFFLLIDLISFVLFFFVSAKSQHAM